jgi:hypothetical protein
MEKSSHSKGAALVGQTHKITATTTNTTVAASRSAKTNVGTAAITVQPPIAAADTPIACISPPSSPDVSEVYDASGVDVNIDLLPARLPRG